MIHSNHYPQTAKAAFKSTVFLSASIGFLSNVEKIEDTDQRKVFRAYTESKSCYEIVKSKIDGKFIYYIEDVTDLDRKEKIPLGAEHGILISIIDYNQKLQKAN